MAPLVSPTDQRQGRREQPCAGPPPTPRSSNDSTIVSGPDRPPRPRVGWHGRVGEGIVRRFLSAGAHVVVPTRSDERAEELRNLLGPVVTDQLHLVVHDYTTFAGAQDLATQLVRNLGGIDAVVAPVGGWWSGRRLWEIDEDDWQNAFVGLATAHMALARACVPLMDAAGAYLLVVGTRRRGPCRAAASSAWSRPPSR